MTRDASRTGPSRTVYAAARALGRLLETSLNRVALEPDRVVKSRRALYPLPLVNACLAGLGCGVRFLGGAAWLENERAVHARTSGARVEAAPRGIAVSRLPGVPLSRFLADAPAERHPPALAAAFAALARLHAVAVASPEGAGRTVSHADAMAGNVLYDEESGAAAWFDFETVHDPRWSEAERRADDLWSLAFSAAKSASPDEVARALREGYPHAEARRALARTIGRPRAGRLVYHLSQAPLRRERFEETSAALRAALGEAAT